MKLLLTREQFLDLNPTEYQAFFAGLNAREKYKEELQAMGLSKDDVRQLLKDYYRKNTSLVPARFKKPISKNQPCKYLH